MTKLYRGILLMGMALNTLLPGCSDDSGGKKTGELCLSHEECASKLCTLPALPDSGRPGDGGLSKQCQETTIR